MYSINITYVINSFFKTCACRTCFSASWNKKKRKKIISTLVSALGRRVCRWAMLCFLGLEAQPFASAACLLIAFFFYM